MLFPGSNLNSVWEGITTNFCGTTHIATAGNSDSEEGVVISFGVTDSNCKASSPTPEHYTKTDQGSSGLRKSVNFMDELQLKFTEAVAKSNYINTTIVPLCESFFKTVVFFKLSCFCSSCWNESFTDNADSHWHS